MEDGAPGRSLARHVQRLGPEVDTGEGKEGKYDAERVHGERIQERNGEADEPGAQSIQQVVQIVGKMSGSLAPCHEEAHLPTLDGLRGLPGHKILLQVGGVPGMCDIVNFAQAAPNVILRGNGAKVFAHP